MMSSPGRAASKPWKPFAPNLMPLIWSLLTWTMPAPTGIDLAKELMAIRPDVPIILCTGFSELINGKQVKEAGIREFVMKPYATRNFANTIRKVLEKK